MVRRIYQEFLEGKSTYKIASGLQKDGILTGAGRDYPEVLGCFLPRHISAGYQFMAYKVINNK